MRHRFLAGMLAVLAVSPLIAAAQVPAYKKIAEWHVGGTGGWDYLQDDSAAHRLYVTHGDRVEVLDTDTGKVVGSLDGLMGTHGIALDTDGTTGYITDGKANAVIVFDRKTLARLASIPAGMNPDGIVFEPKTHTVWAFNGRSNSVTVISAKDRKVIATIAVPGKPEFPVADGEGSVFDNIESKNEIVRFDAAKLVLTATWPLAGCESPSGLAIDSKGHRLFSVCDEKVMAVTDSRTGKQIAKVAIDDGPDAARFDPATGLAFSSNGAGTLTVVDTTRPGFPAQNFPTQRGARTLALDPADGRIFLATATLGPAPAPTAEHPHQRPTVVPDSFAILVMGR